MKTCTVYILITIIIIIIPLKSKLLKVQKSSRKHVVARVYDLQWIRRYANIRFYIHMYIHTFKCAIKFPYNTIIIIIIIIIIIFFLLFTINLNTQKQNTNITNYKTRPFTGWARLN
jgi:hypothetical protein